MNVYIPMTVNILTVGHIKILEKLSKTCKLVIIGLLTTKALKGYKNEKVAFRDRRYIIETVASTFDNVYVFPQSSLNPTRNLKKYHFDAMASGDGFEQIEIYIANKLGIKLLDVKSGGKLHSSDIK